ncbi:hypothetical protein SAMN05192559_101981 [Halobacillus karajensis]|uniref:Uncharacterized protein n=1 Tax=Halobacillus karajensis TaxID=195088 RepID=A0A059NXN9_9BACI|nr:hypothetical protein [Halobacillus karajensis]CDQ18405.1 hypothetical protein BN982_00675 [Halobacillus karajensis]CDQ23523.1 hypothetical protein BN983_01753 [Halobacillus karajensis]CDQ27005.1 hypothetical protein BN981_01233 [Halobacillus karajensis]SEH51840.1 hypothetical protein SAMN05192559_101981 [Halobacillus karajensis]
MNVLWESFDKNEISVLILLLISYTLLFLLPSKFNRDVSLLFLLFGFTIGVFFDFTIGGGLVDFFTLNDSNHYELFDLLYYLSFAPFSYFFIYFYESLHINKRTFIFYIIGWAAIGLMMQWVFTKLGIVEFQKGFTVPYSFAVFLITQTITSLYYELIRSRFVILKKTSK